jgi:hypothetical protein
MKIKSGWTYINNRKWYKISMEKPDEKRSLRTAQMGNRFENLK